MISGSSNGDDTAQVLVFVLLTIPKLVLLPLHVGLAYKNNIPRLYPYPYLYSYFLQL